MRLTLCNMQQVISPVREFINFKFTFYLESAWTVNFCPIRAKDICYSFRKISVIRSVWARVGRVCTILCIWTMFSFPISHWINYWKIKLIKCLRILMIYYFIQLYKIQSINRSAWLPLSCARAWADEILQGWHSSRIARATSSNYHQNRKTLKNSYIYYRTLHNTENLVLVPYSKN